MVVRTWVSLEYVRDPVEMVVMSSRENKPWLNSSEMSKRCEAYHSQGSECGRRGTLGLFRGPVVDTVILIRVSLEHVPEQLAQVVVVGPLEKIERSAVAKVCSNFSCKATIDNR